MSRHVYGSLVALAMSVLCSCHGKGGPDPNELAAHAAKIYYDYLVEGKYEAYVDAFYQPDSIPASYREQLVVSAKQYAGQMREDHGGLNSVDIVNAVADTARHTGHAFLVLAFNDSTREEIVVPMVLHRGNWMLR